MSTLFGGKPKTPSLPKVIPAQLPTSSPDSQAYNAQKALRGSGFEKTILAGALEPAKTKKTILGSV